MGDVKYPTDIYANLANLINFEPFLLIDSPPSSTNLSFVNPNKELNIFCILSRFMILIICIKYQISNSNLSVVPPRPHCQE